jgi:hypothetical protein
MPFYRPAVRAGFVGGSDLLPLNFERLLVRSLAKCNANLLQTEIFSFSPECCLVNAENISCFLQ